MTPPAGCGPAWWSVTPRKRTCERWETGCSATDDHWRITPIRTASFAIAAVPRPSRNSCAEKKRSRSSDEPCGNWASNGSRHTVRRRKDVSRLFGTLQDRLVKEMRLAGIDSIRRGQPLFADALSCPMGTAIHGGCSQTTQCASPTGWRTAAGRNSECARGTEGGGGLYRQLGRSSLGRASGGSVYRTSWGRSGNRTTAGWLALVALSETLFAFATLPGSHARLRKSFRPTASRTCETKSPSP